jgi:hypothetical protein
MSFSDKIDMREHYCLTEFANDIFLNLRLEEGRYVLKTDYLSKMQLSTEVKETSRAFLIEWIIDVHRKFRLLAETLYIAVFLIDRFLSL